MITIYLRPFMSGRTWSATLYTPGAGDGQRWRELANGLYEARSDWDSQPFAELADFAEILSRRAEFWR